MRKTQISSQLAGRRVVQQVVMKTKTCEKKVEAETKCEKLKAYSEKKQNKLIRRVGYSNLMHRH